MLFQTQLATGCASTFALAVVLCQASTYLTHFAREDPWPTLAIVGFCLVACVGDTAISVRIMWTCFISHFGTLGGLTQLPSSVAPVRLLTRTAPPACTPRDATRA